MLSVKRVPRLPVVIIDEALKSDRFIIFCFWILKKKKTQKGKIIGFLARCTQLLNI